MLTRRAFLLHYKALKEYADLRSLSEELHPDPLGQYQADYIFQFMNPYVCVIHKDGRGYYLNRSYQHIVSVHDIPVPILNEPGIPALLQRCVDSDQKHQAASFTTPDWASKLPPSEFTTYWLY